MSGSGGGGGSGLSGGGSGRGGASRRPVDDEPIPCEALVFETQLSSPKSAVVDTLKKGDVLEIALKQEGSVQSIQILFGKKVAGGLTSPDASRLRECILGGYKYEAVVKAVVGGQVKVRISPAG